MNLIEKNVASIIQKHSDTGALLSLSSASRHTHKLFRLYLLGRMITLYNLATDLPDAEVMPALYKKITDESQAVALEILAQPDWIRDRMTKYGLLTAVPEGDILVKRQALRAKVSTLIIGPLKAGEIRSSLRYVSSPASLNFLLSTARQLSPQDRKATALNTATIGRMLALGEVDNGRLLCAWNSLIGQWRTMSACQQAEALLGLGRAFTNAREIPTHLALPLIRAAIEDETLGWAHDAMRQFCSHLLTSRVTHQGPGPGWPEQEYAIIDILKAIANPLSLCHEKPILDTYCEAIQDLLGCTTQAELDASKATGRVHILEKKLAYLKEHVGSMSAQEQIAVIYTIVKNFTYTLYPLHPEFPVVQAFIKDNSLPWAHAAIPQAFSYVVATRAALHHDPVAISQMHAVVKLFKKATKSTSVEECEAITAQMGCIRI